MAGTLPPSRIWTRFNILPALWCLLARACNNSSMLVPFSVSRIPGIYCTKSILHPACPLFSTNHCPLVSLLHFPIFRTSTSVLCTFLPSSYTYYSFHTSCIDTYKHLQIIRFDDLLPFFFVQKSPPFFWRRLELFTVLPFFYQTVKTRCILQRSTYLFSLLLHCLCSRFRHETFVQHCSCLCHLIDDEAFGELERS